MMIKDILRLSTRMFRTNRSRTILTILGIGVGIGAILFLVSMGYGLQKLILGQITTSEALLSLDVNVGDLTNIKLDSEALDKIKNIPEVETVSPVISTPAQVKIDEISSELLVHFANSNFFRFEGSTVKKGDFYTDEDKDKAIISTAALKLFNITENNFRDKKAKFNLVISDDSKGTDNILRRVVHIEQDFSLLAIIDDEEFSYVYIPFSASDNLGINEYSKLKVKVRHEDDLDNVRNNIIEMGYAVSALSDIIEQANQIFRVVQITLALFGVVALVVSAIGMFNTMTITLLERTQEIGIMKALGATGLDIWKMFLAESVIIGFLGGLSGIMVGFFLGEIFNYGINILAGALGGEKIDLFYTPLWFVLLIIFFSTLVGLATGFYPASRAARINCLEALRYK